MATVLEVKEFPLFIGGKWTPAQSGETFDVINPATGQVVAKVAKAGKEDVDLAVQAARKTFDSGAWSRQLPETRAAMLMLFAQKIMENADELVYLESISSGGTVRRVGFSDILQIADLLMQTAKFIQEYKYVEHLPVPPFPGPAAGQVWREPIGVCAAITPWNFPMILAMWKVVPALAMGNCIVVKPASNTPLSTLKLAELASQAGIPAGAFNVVAGPGASVGEALVTHPLVDKVAFTGSTEVGRRIMQMAAGSVKKVTLELGGKSPSIILPDADLDIAIPGALFGVFMHAGQICESGTRLFVHESMYDEVIERLAAKTKEIKLGDPLSSETGMGPVVSKQQFDTVLQYIRLGQEEGARLVCGGKPVVVEGCEGGYFIEPTIFADVTNDMRIAQEEIFGPVLVVIKYKDVAEAIRLANDTMYGLAAGVWTRNINEAYRIARELKAGTVWINDWHMLRSDAPFGGYKQSGFGRELGRHALDEYTQVKHVHASLVPEVEKRTWLGMLFG
ncbi:aldehyde dehydrogenase family protein [Alicyclobacillus cycloheptanicus]|uniref:Aldehyde dehydrogenase (NAD+) n=1 Tax=Alicyclobacillus cycloheptanicus TaxID=1457 RepID=A0ABT9XH07_9BACL|nr:aldehyde dehydrogenase family protein [Alicyclobacillus cycloheptanicus]MDQ0189591.1 aldehyde dehydrogenase (NAD+) [Alicyclobacillus cycloheptanicus]WDL99902.1 aldehyde dehydrogenase family protein [Alicyclobacillus cycloheptanicus]